jgi:hypothetical protein
VDTVADLDRRGINRAERVARGDDKDRAETAALCSAKLRHKAVRVGQRRGPGDAIRSGPIFKDEIRCPGRDHVPGCDIDRLAADSSYKLRGGSGREVDRKRGAGLDDAREASAGALKARSADRAFSAPDLGPSRRAAQPCRLRNRQEAATQGRHKSEWTRSRRSITLYLE